ncbi:hypothetical protein ACWELQ_31610, partial [Nocardia sp. NPDC004722]
AVPQPRLDLARQLVPADGTCTPVADLTAATVVERARDFLTRTTGTEIDSATVETNATALQAFLHDTRITHTLAMRRTEELGPTVVSSDYGPLTFLANLGFDIYEGKALDTVPLADFTVENTLDLVALALDTTSLLLTTGTTLLSLTGVGAPLSTPLAAAQTLAFAPTTYGVPILRGVLQSVCAS